MHYLPITLVGSKFELFHGVIGEDPTNIPEMAEIEGVGRLSQITLRTVPGMTAKLIVLSFAIGVASGLTANGISAWLAANFPHQEVMIFIGDDPARKLTQEELTIAVEEYLQRKKASNSQDKSVPSMKP